jgi:hypothetical protein
MAGLSEMDIELGGVVENEKYELVTEQMKQ